MSGVELALTASHGRALCALRRDDGVVLVGSATDTGRGDVAPVVAALFTRAGLAPTDLAALRVDVGPGSYTGLRIAITFARTLAAFRSLPIATITNFELQAVALHRVRALAVGATLRVVLDARRERHHTGRLRVSDTIETLEAPNALDAPSLVARFEQGDVLAADPTSLERFASTIRDRGATCVALEPLLGEDLFDPRLRPIVMAPEAIEPLYLMGSYAEEA